MSVLTPEQETMLSVWQRHAYGEFIAQDPDIAIGTMGPDPYIIAMPFDYMLEGREQVYAFYSNDFLTKIPEGLEMEPLNTVVGSDTVVDEFIVRFNHSIEMPWQVPGVPPTGRDAEIVMSVYVGFKDGLISYEHLFWDHASLLYQLGVIDHPAAAGGIHSAARVRRMMAKGVRAG